MKTAKRNTKSQTQKILGLFLLTIIVLSNIPPINTFLLPNYHYQNHSGSFQYNEYPSKGLTYAVGQRRWQEYLNQTNNPKDDTLYRTFQIRPWAFWEWGQYIVNNKRYWHPYLEN